MVRSPGGKKNISSTSFDGEDAEPFLENSYQQNAGLRKRNQKHVAHYGITESHQYELDESEVWRHHQLQRHFEDKGHWWTFAKKREVRRWLLTLITGFICGCVAIFVAFFTKTLTRYKFRVFYELLEKEKTGEIIYGAAFMFLTCCNCLFIIVAWSMVYIEPLAAGSGMGEHLPLYHMSCLIPLINVVFSLL